MEIEAGRAREGTAHLNGLIQHDDGVPGEPKIFPASARTAENDAFELSATMVRRTAHDRSRPLRSDPHRFVNHRRSRGTGCYCIW